jgi:hypothetical protein
MFRTQRNALFLGARSALIACAKRVVFAHRLEVSQRWSLPETYRRKAGNKPVVPIPNKAHQSLPDASGWLFDNNLDQSRYGIMAQIGPLDID